MQLKNLFSLSALSTLLAFAAFSLTASGLTKQQLASLVQRALDKPSIITRLAPENKTILHTLVSGSDSFHVEPLIKYITQAYSLQDLQSREHDPVFWRVLADCAFHHLAQIDSEKAQEFVEEFVIPEHPFHQDLRGLFKTSEFFKKDFFRLNAFFEHAIAPIFKDQWCDIFSNPKLVDTQDAFQKLLAEHRDALSWKYGPDKLSCSFLLNIPLDTLRILPVGLSQSSYEFYWYTTDFAAKVYDEMNLSSSELAHAAKQALIKASPLLDAKATLGRDYYETIYAYLENTSEPSLLEQLKIHIREDLQAPHIYQSLSHHTRAILKALQQDSGSSQALREAFQCFLHYLSDKRAFQRFTSNLGRHGNWDDFINTHLVHFISVHPTEAQTILTELLLPNTPLLLAHHLGLPEKISQLFDEEEASLYLDFAQEAAQEAFSTVLDQISPKNSRYTQLQFIDLMHKYKDAMSHLDSTYKYHFTFLANAGFKAFESTAAELFNIDHYSFFGHPAVFATQLYNKMTHASAEQAHQARRALQRINKKEYSKSIGKDYAAVINTYLESGCDPAGLQQLKYSIARALADLRISNKLSDQQIEILQKLQGGSAIYNLFSCYIFQNYELYYVEQKDQPFFWCSLLFSSIHSFALTFPDLAQEMTDLPIIPFEPLSTEPPPQNLIFSEVLTSFATSHYPLRMAVSWGHTHTVTLLFNHDHSPIAVNHAGEALYNAASNGHKNIFKLLPARVTGQRHQGPAFVAAASDGHKDIVELLIAESGITPNDFGEALRNAASDGHKDIVQLLLPHVDDAGYLGWAVKYAASNGHKDTIQFLFTHSMITPDSAGEALEYAANDGHKDSVEIILTHSSISNGHDYGALKNAVWNGHKDTVKLFLADSRFTPDHFGRALKSAAMKGHKNIVELLLPRVTCPDHLSKALEDAIARNYTKTAALIHQRIDSLKTA